MSSEPTKGIAWKNNLRTLGIHAVAVVSYIPLMILVGIFVGLADQFAGANIAGVMTLLFFLYFVAYVASGYFMLEPLPKNNILSVLLLLSGLLIVAGMHYMLGFAMSPSGMFGVSSIAAFQADMLNAFYLMNPQAIYTVMLVLFGQYGYPYYDYTLQQYSIGMLISALVPPLLLYLGLSVKIWHQRSKAD
ncbi:MAG: hypothetical protein FWE48_07110 [Coriobacteriia bacterium]|nr:hypothetical protein [Coriobacteriia bacterium]